LNKTHKVVYLKLILLEKIQNYNTKLSKIIYFAELYNLFVAVGA